MSIGVAGGDSFGRTPPACRRYPSAPLTGPCSPPAAACRWPSTSSLRRSATMLSSPLTKGRRLGNRASIRERSRGSKASPNVPARSAAVGAESHFTDGGVVVRRGSPRCSRSLIETRLATSEACNARNHASDFEARSLSIARWPVRGSSTSTRRHWAIRSSITAPTAQQLWASLRRLNRTAQKSSRFRSTDDKPIVHQRVELLEIVAHPL